MHTLYYNGYTANQQLAKNYKVYILHKRSMNFGLEISGIKRPLLTYEIHATVFKGIIGSWAVDNRRFFESNASSIPGTLT